MQEQEDKVNPIGGGFDDVSEADSMTSQQKKEQYKKEKQKDLKILKFAKVILGIGIILMCIGLWAFFKPLHPASRKINTPENTILQTNQNKVIQIQTNNNSNQTVKANQKHKTTNNVTSSPKNNNSVTKQNPVINASKKSQSPTENNSSFHPFDQDYYRITKKINLWDYSPEDKQRIFSKYKSKQGTQPKSKFMQITLGKDEQFTSFASGYQINSEVIDWSSLQLTQTDIKSQQRQFNIHLQQRRQQFSRVKTAMQTRYIGKSGFVKDESEITYNDFLQKMDYYKLTGQKYERIPELNKVYQREKTYFNQKYGTENITKEIPACVIVPTYNNEANYRYAWNLESLLQQEYGKYRIVIVDDASTDQTSQSIARYLKWRGVDKDKVVLLRNKQKRTATENFYYAVHKYCDYNQIFYTVDGDDELVGTQVFKLYNALYQRNKTYVMYSNFFSYFGNNDVSVGISSEYPEPIQSYAYYRSYKHAYSHIRTMMTDIFLLISMKSFKDAYGKFYWIAADNAIYYPAMQLGCGASYIRELSYWYNSNTGLNDWRTGRRQEYKNTNKHILDQKKYQCINTIFEQLGLV